MFQEISNDLNGLICSFLNRENAENWDALAFFNDKRVPSKHLAFLRFFSNHSNPNTIPLKETEKHYTFILCCARGRMDKVTFLLQNVHFTIFPSQEALNQACSFGQIEIVRLLCRIFLFTNRNGFCATIFAIQSQHRRVIEFMNETFQFEHIHRQEHIEVAMQFGSVCFVQWMFTCPAYIGMGLKVGHWFRLAVENGNMEIAKYLRETYQFDYEIQDMIRERSLTISILHYKTFRYLWETFPLFKKYIWRNCFVKVKDLSKTCLLDSIRYIHDTFPLGCTMKKIRSENDLLLSSAIEKGDLCCVDYLVTNFYNKGPEEREGVLTRFFDALGSKNVSIAHYLQQQFHFSKEECKGRFYYVTNLRALRFCIEHDLICEDNELFCSNLLPWASVRLLSNHQLLPFERFHKDLSTCDFKTFECLIRYVSIETFVSHIMMIPLDLTVATHLFEYFSCHREKLIDGFRNLSKVGWGYQKVYKLDVLPYFFLVSLIHQNDLENVYWNKILRYLLWTGQIDVFDFFRNEFKICKRWARQIWKQSRSFFPIESIRYLYETFDLSIQNLGPLLTDFGPQHKDICCVTDLLMDKRKTIGQKIEQRNTKRGTCLLL